MITRSALKHLKFNLETIALDVRRMQQLVCLMAAGLAAHPFVALLDDGVQVALSERLGRVSS